MEHTHQTIKDMVTGDEVCTRCGLVLQERISDYTKNSQLGQKFDTSEADLSTGLDMTQHDFGLGSTFDIPNDGGLSPEYRETLRRMRRLNAQARVKSWHERSLRSTMIDLDKLCERLYLPKGMQREIAYWYRKLKASHLTMGRDHWAVLAALTYIVCARRNMQRAEEEFVAPVEQIRGYGRFDAKKLRRLVRRLCDENKELSTYLKVAAPNIDDRVGKFVEPCYPRQFEFVENVDKLVEKTLDFYEKSITTEDKK